MAKVYIGTSGYSYAHWADGVFYPAGLRQNQWLNFYCQHFDTVELNVTFYRLPKKEAFSSWMKKTPDDFVFSVKGSRFITHIKRLNAAAQPLSVLFKRMEPLSSKAAVVLWQLAPKTKCNIKRLQSFIRLLNKYQKYKHVFEFRHQGWFNEGTYKLLKDSNMALCSADWPEFAMDVHPTADFVYIRRHGTGAALYSGCYSKAQLRKDADIIKRFLAQGKDVFIYFNNDAHGWAVKNATALKGILEKKK